MAQSARQPPCEQIPRRRAKATVAASFGARLPLAGELAAGDGGGPAAPGIAASARSVWRLPSPRLHRVAGARGRFCRANRCGGLTGESRKQSRGRLTRRGRVDRDRFTPRPIILSQPNRISGRTGGSTLAPRRSLAASGWPHRAAGGCPLAVFLARLRSVTLAIDVIGSSVCNGTARETDSDRPVSASAVEADGPPRTNRGRPTGAPPRRVPR
jgi:hypothetical protein